MSCVVRVHNLETSPQIVIPGRAIVEQMGEYFVYIAKDTMIRSPADSANTASSDGHKEGGAKDEAAADHKSDKGDSVGAADSTAKKGPHLVAIQVKVEEGQTIGSNVLIKSGLHNGDRIVVDGIQALHDGSPITTSNRQGPPAPGRGGR